MNRKGIDFSFGWIFAIIIGAAIISLAVYGAVRFGNSERNVQDSQSAQELGSLMSPLETGVEEAKTGIITFPIESRIYFGCDSRGTFGTQDLAVATSSSIGNQWQNPGVNLSAKNKYIFSSKILQGNKFIVFSKPFEFPFKLASLVFMWDDKKRYCFVNSPSEISDELKQLFIQTNITSSVEVVENLKDCSKSSVKICFSSSGCNIDVYPESNKLIKNGQTLYYTGALLYGAIFSDADSYECQVRRLMNRASEISSVYLAKIQYMGSKSSGCGSSLQPLFSSYNNQTANAGSNKLGTIKLIADEMGRTNEGISTCKVF